MKEKVLSAISHTISGTDQENKMDQARRISIKEVSQMGKYTMLRNHPVLVEFYHKSDVEYLIGNQTHLPKTVYVDKQYCDETE